jgi:uncharacterized protein YfaP (DUF2135 family)
MKASSIFSLFISILLTSYAFAGTSVKGHLVNNQGEALPYAYVIVKDSNGGVNRVEDADGNGDFLITGIPEGEYQLEVRYFNLETYESEILQFTSGIVDMGEITLSPTLGLEATVIVSRVEAPVHASISGKLQDDTGEVLPFANVIIKNSEGNIISVEDSSNSGSFRIGGLPLGQYQIEVNYFGTETYESGMLELGAEGLDLGKIQLPLTDAARKNLVLPKGKIRA